MDEQCPTVLNDLLSIIAYDVPKHLNQHLLLQAKERTSNDTKLELQKIANDILGMDVSPQQPLMEAGLDSLAATEMRNAISTSFTDHELPATFVFDYPTIDAMVQYFDTRHKDETSTLVSAASQDGPVHAFYGSEIIGMSCRYPSNHYGADSHELALT